MAMDYALALGSVSAPAIRWTTPLSGLLWRACSPAFYIKMAVRDVICVKGLKRGDEWKMIVKQ
jgi:hypothetical protein